MSENVKWPAFPVEPESDRRPFVNRPRKGRTARIKKFPGERRSHPTNVGDPNQGNSAKGKKG